MRSVLLMTATFGAVLTTSLLSGSPAMANHTPAHVDRNAANPPIDFPYALRVRGAQGSAILKVHVTFVGHPDRVQIVQSTGDKDLDNVAAGGVLNWHYVPANNDGENVSDWAIVRVDFKIDANGAPTPAAPAPGASPDRAPNGSH